MKADCLVPVSIQTTLSDEHRPAKGPSKEQQFPWGGGGLGMALAKAESWGQVTLRPDTVHSTTTMAAWEVGQGPSPELPTPTPLLLSPVVPPETPEPTGKPWREAETIFWNGQGLLQKPVTLAPDLHHPYLVL